MYYDNYGTESLVDATMSYAPLTGLFLGIMIFSSIISLIAIISYWKLFNKAGKPGWASIIPIYNNIVMIEIAKLPMIYLLFMFLPIANIFALFKINIEMAKNFGKTSGYGVGMALLSIIFVPMLAFSDSKYIDSEINNNNDKNTFDATNIINGGTEQQTDSQTINNITTSNIPLQTTNIQTEQISNNSQAINNIIPTVNELSNDVVVENNVNSIASVEPGITEQEPSNMVDGNNQQINNDIPIIPVIPVVTEQTMEQQPELNIQNNQQVVNEVPIDNQTTNIVEETPVSAFNSKPMYTQEIVSNPINQTESTVQPIENSIQNNEVPVMESQVVTENANFTQSGVIEQKKLCKVCGSEMPNIVSICPKCGTDNE